MEPLFAELCAKSSFSFLEGASHPREVVSAAKELDLAAVALCDRDGIYGSVRAHTAAREIGQKVIVGAELTIDDGGSTRRSAELRPQTPVEPKATVALLAMDHAGYGNLCALLTAA